jgi:hypothetical protein
MEVSKKWFLEEVYFLPPGRVSVVADFLKNLYSQVFSLRVHPQCKYAVDLSGIIPDLQFDDPRDFFQKLNKKITSEFKVKSSLKKEEMPLTNNKFSELLTSVVHYKCKGCNFSTEQVQLIHEFKTKRKNCPFCKEKCKSLASVSSQYLLFSKPEEIDVSLNLQFESHVYELIGVVCKEKETSYCYTRRATFSDFDQQTLKL